MNSSSNSNTLYASASPRSFPKAGTKPSLRAARACALASSLVANRPLLPPGRLSKSKFAAPLPIQIHPRSTL
ncbi:MAG: hypothetical protein ACFFKA_16845 [Candidatus Thorarchaeota archaeon]